MDSARARERARRLIPPALLDALRAWRGGWRHAQGGWPDDPPEAGWNAPSVADSYESRTDLLATAATDAAVHNTIMCFAHAVARAAWSRPALRVLDYGGGTGAYFDVARSLFPDLDLHYTCLDLPHVNAVGRRLRPNVHFVDSPHEAFNSSYDLVFASGSMHYSRDWRETSRLLAGCTSAFAYFTRIPIVAVAPSFVVNQRAYGTEYPGWFLNRGEFLSACAGVGLHLEHEFWLDERPVVRDAPEQAEYRGYLFRRHAT